MQPTSETKRDGVSDQVPAVHLEALIPIAIVIAAGCESCAESMVERALGEGTPAPLIRRTLATVAYLRSRECFAQAVGLEVVARMEKPLAAGTRTLRASEQLRQKHECCR